MSSNVAASVGKDTQAYVDDLVADAKLVADYGLRAGRLRDGVLYAAIAKVEEPPAKSPYSPEVLALQAALSRALDEVPYSTLLELKKGWRPGDRNEAKGLLGALVTLSVLLMITIGNLSQTYNRGVVLISEIQAISVLEPSRRYGELIRQLIEARQAISVGSSGAGDGAQLRRSAYFQTFNELRTLDTKLSSLAVRAQQFIDDTAYPIFGTRTALYLAYKIQGLLGVQSDEARAFLQADDRASLPAVPPPLVKEPPKTDVLKPPALSLMDIACPTLKRDDEYATAQANYIKGKIGGPDEFAKITQDFIYETSYLRCFQSFQSNPNYLPDLETSIRKINDNIAPYSLWVMPSLFGAIGAIIFHLRLIVNPLEPSPSLFRIVHRVAFGALAGMALAWFWVPEVRFGVEMPDVGFGLYAMAFIVGFSLDVFFSMLDRFVALANTAVGNMGAGRKAT